MENGLHYSEKKIERSLKPSKKSEVEVVEEKSQKSVPASQKTKKSKHTKDSQGFTITRSSQVSWPGQS